MKVASTQETSSHKSAQEISSLIYQGQLCKDLQSGICSGALLFPAFYTANLCWVLRVKMLWCPVWLEKKDFKDKSSWEETYQTKSYAGLQNEIVPTTLLSVYCQFKVLLSAPSKSLQPSVTFSLPHFHITILWVWMVTWMHDVAVLKWNLNNTLFKFVLSLFRIWWHRGHCIRT